MTHDDFWRAALQKGYVISDLHLFTQRSEAYKQMERIHRAASDADFLVLNGDIFDFHWTTFNGLDETLHAAVEWLTELLHQFDHCQLFYIMGNHDGLACFAEHLDELANAEVRFRWHPSHFRLGSNLFFHGDLPLCRQTTDPLYRELLEAKPIKGKLQNWGYRAVIASRLHLPVVHVHSPKWCARRITATLEKYHPAILKGVRNIYFGHIHKPFFDVEHNGVAFHNTGSTIRGMKLKVLKVRV